ncbi:MAG: internal scaffolding protein [Microvirus sp.]|nr:MAG: internal scaffolding protein [Microvirus sp.]
MFKPHTLRSANGYNTDDVSRETGLECKDPTLAQQQFKDETDINTIVQRFGLTGELPTNYRPPQSGDFTDVTDFHTAMNAVRAATESFMEMPGELRARFANDPQRLMTFLEDPSNKEEALKLGLTQLPPEQPRGAVQAIDDLTKHIIGSKLETPPTKGTT